MKSVNLGSVTKLVLLLITFAALVCAEVRSGFWLLTQPSADSLMRIDFSDLVASNTSPLYRNTACDSLSADCFFKNGHIIAPGGIYYDSVLSSRCDSLFYRKNIQPKFNEHFYLDSIIKQIKLSMPLGKTFTDSVSLPVSYRVLFIKTRENHNAALIKVGEYIGGIDRSWYYWAYRPDGEAALFKQQIFALPDPRQLKIVLEVFSGRPNPEFTVNDSSTVAAITNAAFSSINTLFDSTAQMVGMLECADNLSYRGLSVSGAFPYVDYKLTDYNPTFMICSGNITLNHSEPWKSEIAPLLAKDRDARLEKLVIKFGCELNLMTNDQYGTLKFCELVPDSLKPSTAPISPDRSALHNGRTSIPAVSIRGNMIHFCGGRQVRSIDISDLAGRCIHTFICRGEQDASFPVPIYKSGCYLVSLRFTDGSSAKVQCLMLR